MTSSTGLQFGIRSEWGARSPDMRDLLMPQRGPRTGERAGLADAAKEDPAAYWEDTVRESCRRGLLTRDAMDAMRGWRAPSDGEDPSPACGLRLGFDIACAVREGTPDACWFMNRGFRAWVSVLGPIRMALGASQDLSERVASVDRASCASDEVEIRRAFADIVACGYEHHPLVQLYHASIALWLDNDPSRALRLLDAVCAMLDAQILASAGTTITLTYGLGLGLTGRFAEARDILTRLDHPWLAPDTRDDPDAPECLYQAARYSWLLANADHELDSLRSLIVAHPVYAIRLFGDPIWRQAPVGGERALNRMLNAIVRDARATVADWLQSDNTCDAAQGAADKTIRALVSAVGGADYGILVAAHLVASARQARREHRARNGATLRQSAAAVLGLAAALPSEFVLSLGPGFARRFSGTADSDASRLEALLDQDAGDDALALLERLEHALPSAIPVALVTRTARLADALVESGEALERAAAASPTDLERRLGTIGTCCARCVDLVPHITGLPAAMGSDLASQAVRVWRALMEIEQDWWRSEQRAIGEWRIVDDGAERRLTAGSEIAWALSVADGQGRAVAGAPVLWRVVSGDALPRTTGDCLDEECAITRTGGVAYLEVAAPVGATAGGVIDCWLPGDHRISRLEYAVGH